jgi:anti-sigma B factor antagonist
MMLESLKLTMDPGDGVVVVSAAGEVDLGNAEQLAAALRAAAAGPDAVVLDLLEVPFMDSSGLKVLLVAGQELGERLTLALDPASPVARLLELAEVRDRFEVHPTVAEATARHGT